MNPPFHQSLKFYNHLYSTANKKLFKVLRFKKLHFDIYCHIIRYVCTVDNKGLPICDYIDVEGTRYFWIHFGSIKKEFELNSDQTKYAMHRLMGKRNKKKKSIDPKNVPFFSIHIPNSSGRGSRSFLAVNVHFLKALISEEGIKQLTKGAPMTELSLIEPPKELSPSPIPEQVQNIIDILRENDFGCFQHKVDYTKPSKIIQKCSKFIQNIYTGCVYGYLIREMSPEYKEKNNITSFHKNMLTEVSGDWEKVRRLMVRALSNYELWFREGYLPESKEWLPRRLDEWFFQPYKQRSVFMACLKEPEKVGELYVDRVFSSLPRPVQDLGDKFYHPQLDAMKYWMGLKDVWEFYCTIKTLGGTGYKTGVLAHWAPSLKSFLNHYFEFLYSRGTPYNSQLGIGNSTFRFYVESTAGEELGDLLNYFKQNRQRVMKNLKKIKKN